MSSFKSLTMAATLAAFFVAGCQTTKPVKPAPEKPACKTPQHVIAHLKSRGVGAERINVVPPEHTEAFMRLFNNAKPPTNYEADVVVHITGAGVALIFMFVDGCEVRRYPTTAGFLEALLGRLESELDV